VELAAAVEMWFLMLPPILHVVTPPLERAPWQV